VVTLQHWAAHSEVPGCVTAAVDGDLDATLPVDNRPPVRLPDHVPGHSVIGGLDHEPKPVSPYGNQHMIMLTQT